MHLWLQFEDPTPALQKMRDRLDLQRMIRSDWMMEQAQQVAVFAVAC